MLSQGGGRDSRERGSAAVFTRCALGVPTDQKYSPPDVTVSKVTPKGLVFGLRLNNAIKVYLFKLISGTGYFLKGIT